ncbi:MAG TPA: tetratricopeptide repeat protein [Bryobacteraceae bacterium]|nr:tetratricopeptide repeat protein [Bryobacteraceae bacterium]
MIRPLLLITLSAVTFAQTPPPRAAQEGQLDGSETLFTVLAAINAAGYDADLDSTATAPIRKQIREVIAAKHLDSVEALKKFYEAHKQANSDAELSQYISFALTLDGPPGFESRLKPEEMPHDVRKLEGLNPLIARFYQDANIAELWKRSQNAYSTMIAVNHGGVAKALLEANAYLRNPTSGFYGRRFQIYVDLLGAPNQIQTRSYKDDYFVVVTPSAEPQIEEIRHAYLHYLLDPLALRHIEQLSRLRPLAELAAPAPALDDAYKNDFLLFATECLIKAVEIRLAHGQENRQALASRDLSEGFVLTPAFADGLQGYEKAVESMRFYFVDLVGQIDLAAEDKRLERVQFAKAATVKKAKHVQPPPEPQLTGPAKTLQEAEELYTKRDLGNARKSYLRVLEQGSAAELHAKAYYGLARIAALEKNPELAEKLFQKTLEVSPDKETMSWAYLYLGRLADAAGDREQAEKNYRSALAVEGAPASVKSAAEKGLAQPFHKDK